MIRSKNKVTGMSDKIYLRMAILDGVKTVVDQNGRQVAGLISMVSECEVNGVDTIQTKIQEHDESGKIITNGGNA